MDGVKDLIRAQAMEIGFSVVGFARAEADVRWKSNLETYVAEGRHGSMDWMRDTLDRRADPKVLWPEARTVIALGTSYAPAGDPQALLAHPDRGMISLYARNRDYHDTVKKRLKALGRWMADRFGCGLKVFVDTAPVMEKPLAQKAGLGWQGRHTNIVSRHFGGWLFLSEIFTDLDLEPDPPEADRCGTCRACVDACPTKALDGEGRLDGRLCISYLTIEDEQPIPEALRPALGNRIYGCDACLAACPWNKFAPPSQEPDFMPRVELTAPRLGDMASLDDAAFREVFTASPVKRAGRDRLVASVMIAVGNSNDLRLRAVAEGGLNDPSALVRDAARWALSRLGGESPGQL